MRNHKHFHVNGREIGYEEFNDLLKESVKQIAGINDVRGFELFSLHHMLSTMSDAVMSQHENACDRGVSSARIGILARLFVDDRLGIDEPLTPTELSRFQHVSKNTISSLIRGLEDQGLVTRELDKQDKRVFRLRITEQGKEIVRDFIPRKSRDLNLLVNGLTDDEVAQLTTLLYKLRNSLMEKLHQNRKNKFGY